MKKLTKEQKFLYSRIAILASSVGWIACAFAGLKGFSFWYGGFVLCFWVAFGLINYLQRTTLWLACHRKIPFALLYGTLMGFLILIDITALNFHIWFYPYYHGFQFLWVYGVLYPVAALNLIELFYFLSKFFGEHLTFIQRKLTTPHKFVDVVESVLFLCMTGVLVGGALSWRISLSALALLILAWTLAYLAKLGFHLKHAKHWVALILLLGVVAAFFNEIPNTVAREWVYLYGNLPFLNDILFSTPLWLWFGWLWFTLFTVRFWVTLILHPKVK